MQPTVTVCEDCQGDQVIDLDADDILREHPDWTCSCDPNEEDRYMERNIR